MSFPALGFGVGLRPQHYPAVEAGMAGEAPEAELLAGIDWFEVISENFFGPGGNPRRMLRAVRERFPVVLHGVAMSLGSVDPLDDRYLGQLAALARETQPAFISDHLCWGSFDGKLAHDLLPLPFSEEALDHVATRVAQVQDRLGQPFVLENVSSYVAFSSSTMSEWEFLSQLVRRTGCRLLLDVNNVYVSAHNHGFDARAFVTGLPAGSVAQIHLAGHSQRGELLIDTHDHPVRDEVWELYRLAIATHGQVPTLIEWDDNIPPFARLVAESNRARAIANAPLAPVTPAGASAPMQPGGRLGDAVGLRTLQQRFFALVTAHEDVPGALARLGWGSGMAEDMVTGDARLGAVGRIGIYNDMYFFRLLDVIKQDFAALAQVLGQDDFRALVADYLEAFPPRDHALRDLARSLPAFITRHVLLSDRTWVTDRAWLADLAALEWARADLFDAADVQPLAHADLQALAPEQFATLRLQAVPSSSILDVDFAVDDLWRALEGQPDPHHGHENAGNAAVTDDATDHAHGPDSVDLVRWAPPARQALRIILWRDGVDVFHRRAHAHEASLLPALLGGTTFGALCDQLGEGRSIDEAAQLAFQVLAGWIQAGLLRAPGA